MTKRTDEHGPTDSPAGPAAPVLGTLRAAEGAGVVRIEDRYDTDIDDLWSAVTDPRRLARWYGEVEGDLRAGGQFTVHLEAAALRATGHVELCEPPRRLQVMPRETDESARLGGGVPFDQELEATLTADGDQVVLVVEIRGLPLDQIASYGAGWQIHAENLATYLAGRDPDGAEARWGDLVPRYEVLAAGIG